MIIKGILAALEKDKDYLIKLVKLQMFISNKYYLKINEFNQKINVFIKQILNKNKEIQTELKSRHDNTLMYLQLKVHSDPKNGISSISSVIPAVFYHIALVGTFFRLFL